MRWGWNRGETHNGDDLGLDRRGDGDEVQVEREVKLHESALQSLGLSICAGRSRVASRIGGARTEESRSPKDTVCTARVIVAGIEDRGGVFRSSASSVGRGELGALGCLKFGFLRCPGFE